MSACAAGLPDSLGGQTRLTHLTRQLRLGFWAPINRARRRPARFIGTRRAAKRHKLGRAVGCRRASAGHGSCAGHSRLKRPPMASLAAHMRCAKVGRNDTIPLRRFWCNSHTPLMLLARAPTKSAQRTAKLSSEMEESARHAYDAKSAI